MNLVRTVLVLTLCVGCRRSPLPAPVVDAGPSNVVQLTPEGLVTAAVRTQKVAAGSFVPHLRLAGAITGDPKHIAQVGARVAGRITAVLVALGDTVKKGQPLVEVDAVELHQTVLELRTAMARQRAAHDTLTRQRQLVGERVGALQDLRRAEAEAEASDATIAEAREHLKFLGLTDADVAGTQAGTKESKSRVASPIDGRIAALDVTLGQVLGGNETIATVADLDAVWAQVRVYERDLTDARVGSAVTVQVPAYPDRTFEGKVTFVSDVLDPRSRSADVRVSLVNPEAFLRPGMSATALVARQNATGLWMPVEAIQRHDGAAVVFVRVGDRRFEARPVVVGDEQGGFVPVTKGIGPDDDVVVEGAFALRGGLERAALEGD